jgi:hypothetical protein
MNTRIIFYPNQFKRRMVIWREDQCRRKNGEMKPRLQLLEEHLKACSYTWFEAQRDNAYRLLRPAEITQSSGAIRRSADGEITHGSA